MDWLDILVPGTALLALFGVVALTIQSIRLGRAVRRLEERGGGRDQAVEVSLRRLRELQARGGRGAPAAVPGRPRRALAAGAVATVLLAAAAGVWYFALRDDGADAAAGTASRPAAPATRRPPAPDRSGRVPANPPPLDNKAAYTVAVYNASGVTGAARDKIAPKLTLAGYALGTIDNAQAQDPSRSVVMFAKGKRVVGWNVAKDLGIRKVTPLDGFDESQTGGADAVVIVGLDLARG